MTYWTKVSIHAPTRGATFYQGTCVPRLYVSIHAPTRGATYQGVCLTAVKSVSIHAPTRGATRLAKNLRTYKTSFQSTHPHGVRLQGNGNFDFEVRVSIHAPTRGATSSAGDGPSSKVVSIHAPTRGATQNQWNIDQWNRVSIHAPTRGATTLRAARGGQANVSIHAPTRGATLHQLSNHVHVLRFNPRTHMGCDKDDSYCLAVFIVSIHAPTWGATDTSYLYLCACKFQSTHPHGVRQSARLIYCSLPSFNPRTHMGCDRKCTSRCTILGVSIHAPTWGATWQRPEVISDLYCFNPRTHMGCDAKSFL